MGSWYVTNSAYKFRYQQHQFVLIGADNFSFHRATQDFEDYSYNFLTKKRVLTKGNDDKGTKKTPLKSLNIATLKLRLLRQTKVNSEKKDIELISCKNYGFA